MSIEDFNRRVEQFLAGNITDSEWKKLFSAFIGKVETHVKKIWPKLRVDESVLEEWADEVISSCTISAQRLSGSQFEGQPKHEKFVYIHSTIIARLVNRRCAERAKASYASVSPNEEEYEDDEKTGAAIKHEVPVDPDQFFSLAEIHEQEEFIRQMVFSGQLTAKEIHFFDIYYDPEKDAVKKLTLEEIGRMIGMDFRRVSELRKKISESLSFLSTCADYSSGAKSHLIKLLCKICHEIRKTEKR